MKTYILYHNDTDGFGSAWSAYNYFGDKAIYIPVNYNQPMPEMEEDSVVYILDFSYSRQELIDLDNKMFEVTVIDHHRTAQEKLKGLPFCEFDMTQSGAVLTWKHFFPMQPVPRILEYVQDYDLWTFKLAYSEEYNAVIDSYEPSFDRWDILYEQIEENSPDILKQGEAILRFREQVVSRIVKEAKIIDFDGYKAVTANVTYPFISKTGNALCKAYPEAQFSLTYFIDGNGNKCYSLRSIGDFDVSEIAKKMKGGGHRNSAGFIVKCSNS